MAFTRRQLYLIERFGDALKKEMKFCTVKINHATG